MLKLLITQFIIVLFANTIISNAFGSTAISNGEIPTIRINFVYAGGSPGASQVINAYNQDGTICTNLSSSQLSPSGCGLFIAIEQIGYSSSSLSAGPLLCATPINGCMFYPIINNNGKILIGTDSSGWLPGDDRFMGSYQNQTTSNPFSVDQNGVISYVGVISTTPPSASSQVVMIKASDFLNAMTSDIDINSNSAINITGYTTAQYNTLTSTYSYYQGSANSGSPSAEDARTQAYNAAIAAGRSENAATAAGDAAYNAINAGQTESQATEAGAAAAIASDKDTVAAAINTKATNVGATNQQKQDAIAAANAAIDSGKTLAEAQEIAYQVFANYAKDAAYNAAIAAGATTQNATAAGQAAYDAFMSGATMSAAIDAGQTKMQQMLSTVKNDKKCILRFKLNS